MDSDSVIRLTSQAMLLCLSVSMPVVLVAAIVGIAVSFFQAITSMQEQTVSQAAKLVAVTVALVVAAPWGGSLILRYAEAAFGMALK